MKITAKLALNQIKLNRHRTIGAISAIIISTALLTAVSCFVTSGNAMLVDFLGNDYGVYGGTYKMILLIPAIIFGMLIFFMSVTVISNVFRTSTNQRMKEFGIIKCVGGTTKQVKETVLYESLWLSIIGIPIGVLLGTGLGFLGIQITGKFIDDMNELSQSIIMRPYSISLSFVINPFTILFSTIFSFITVVYSAYRPAKKTGKITALECIKGMGEIKLPESKIRDKKWLKSVLGFEGVLADRSMSRNKASFRPTIRSLALGIILILSTGSLILQVKRIEDIMDPGTQDVMVDYCSNHNKMVNEKTGLKEDKYSKPITGAEAEKVLHKLLEYGDIDIMGVGADNATFFTTIHNRYLTQDMTRAIGCISDEQGELGVDLIVFDQRNYEKLCETVGIPVGGNILINYLIYNDNGHQKEIVPYSEDLKELKLQKANGETKSFTVDGFLQKDSVPAHVIGFNTNPLRLIVPEAELRFYDWYCQPEDEKEYMTYAKTITDVFFPTITDDSYAKEGFSVRISREDTMVKVLNLAIVIAEIIIYGFVLLMLLIGLVSVISTLSTNVIVRAREFAVLKSVGMTSEGLRKMLIIESLICTIKASIWGVPFGILIPYIINLPIRKKFPIIYEIPWLLLVVSLVTVFSLILLITFVAIQRLKRQNLIETIRMETM